MNKNFFAELYKFFECFVETFELVVESFAQEIVWGGFPLCPDTFKAKHVENNV